MALILRDDNWRFCPQGRPLNVNHEAACIIGKTGGEVETDTLHPKQGGKWKSISVGKNRGEVDIIILLL